jgi:anti-sigma28 factor (negative regulator of flagellin synthesis)
MRIDDRNIGGAAAEQAARTKEAEKVSSGTPARGASSQGGFGDRVEFSEGLGQLAQAISTFGTERQERVQALASQYQSGTYKVDAAATSRAMINEALSATAA